MRNLLFTTFILLVMLPVSAIADEALPYDVSIERLIVPHHYPYLSGKIDYDLLIKNTGTQTIRNIYVHTEISNGSSFDRVVSLTNSLEPGATACATVRYVPNPEQGVYLLTSRIERVNDNMLNSAPSRQAVLAAYDDGYDRKVMVEVSTSAAHGMSPAEKVLLGRIKKKYPHWVTVAVHRDDQMAEPAFDAVAENLLDQVPMVAVNRDIVTENIGQTISQIDSIHEVYSSFPSYANITLDARSALDDDLVQVDASVQFSSYSDFEHRLAFAVVEDNVGPYKQANSYAGGSFGPMGGWENMSSSVSCAHNDVGRYLTGYEGIPGSLPDNLQVGRIFEYSASLPLGNVEHGTYRVVGMIINTWSGEIVNAAQVRVAKSGIESVTDDREEVRISVSNGSIEVTGADTYEVYTLTGCRVAPMGLAPGVYLVHVCGETRRVAVR